jgi:hypothetical protein
MNVTVRYLLRGHQRPECLVLEASEYFDPVEPSQSFEADGIPRFSHARQYLPPGVDVEWTELTEARGPSVTRITEFFSGNGRASHWHRSDPDGGEELCVSSQLSPTTTHIVRMLRSPSRQWTQLFNVIVADHPDGSQTETILFSSSPSHSSGVA